MANEPIDTAACSNCGAPVPMERIKALQYIDGWVLNKLLQGLVPAAADILGDMRVHIHAAIERLERGERMEATSRLMDP